MSKPLRRVKVRKIGNSLGITLPKEHLARLNLEEGDEVSLVESEDGLAIYPYDPEFEKTMELAREGMRNYRNALRELAK